MADMDELYGDLNNFHDKYEYNPVTKCKIWKLNTFRLRTGINTHNPRRLAIQMDGRVIPVRRNLMVTCGNETCVNPDHIRLKGTGEKVPDNAILYIEDFKQFNDSDFNLANRYAVTVAEAAAARKRTLKLIYEVIASNVKGEHRIAKKFNVPVSYIRDILEVTPSQYENYKYDPTTEFADPNVVNPRALKYKAPE